MLTILCCVALLLTKWRDHQQKIRCGTVPGYDPRGAERDERDGHDDELVPRAGVAAAQRRAGAALPALIRKETVRTQL